MAVWRADLLTADMAGLRSAASAGVSPSSNVAACNTLSRWGLGRALRPGLDVRVVVLACLQIRVQGEQHIGVLGAERPAFRGVARLQQHGMTLRRARQSRDAADVELRAAVLAPSGCGRGRRRHRLSRSAITASAAQLSQNSRATVMNSSARW